MSVLRQLVVNGFDSSAPTVSGKSYDVLECVCHSL